MEQMKIVVIGLMLLLSQLVDAQNVVPLDTANWDISNQVSYLVENYKGKNAIYLKGGRISYKGEKFTNGTIEFDLYLKESRSFPGVLFRTVEEDAELFYIRSHQSGNPDANQVLPITNGLSPWQLYFGPKYSFVYNYKYDDWTHVKIVVNDNRAQVFLDHSETPNLSWNLFHPTRGGGISFQGGGRAAVHIADIKISNQTPQIDNFSPGKRASIDGLIQEWEISDIFDSALLSDPSNLSKVISERKWGTKIQVEEGVAANISRQKYLSDDTTEETVFAKIKINADQDQIKLFQFGYSDDVVAILNGKPVYKGTNKFRSRDYRYLGTIGLFDGIYLDLKKGDNTLLMAVSENFGGWLITGKFEDASGVKVE